MDGWMDACSAHSRGSGIARSFTICPSFYEGGRSLGILGRGPTPARLTLIRNYMLVLQGTHGCGRLSGVHALRAAQ
eukprot:7318967-Pyramimonas_sp.AAC.1